MSGVRLPRRQSIRSCIFCGRADLSREHIWPEWAHQFVRKPAPLGRYFKKQFASSPNNPNIRGGTVSKGRQGDVTAITLKVVYGNHCNNGWMSRLETKAKPILVPLLTGNRIALSKYYQEVLLLGSLPCIRFQ